MSESKHRYCHKCEFKPSGEDYYNSPCATCPAEDPLPVSRYSSDPAGFETKLIVMPPAYVKELEEVEAIFASLAVCVFNLIDMRDSHPETFKYVMAKLRSPRLSYSEMAAQFGCKKQNVLYHMKKAVRLMPELSTALLIEKRYLGGRRSALKPLPLKVKAA